MLTIPQMIQQAVQHHTAGKLVDAEAMYAKVLDRAPNEPAALHLFGVLRHQQGRHAEAADLVRRAVRINPRDADAYTNLASICRALNDADGAIDAGRRATQIQPNSPEAWNNLALALKIKHVSEEALHALQRALQLRPNYPEALMNLGNVLADLGRHNDAITAFHAALRIRPTASAWYNLGLALHAMQRDTEAIAALSNAVRLDPRSTESLATLGDLYVHVLRYDEAIETYRRALTINPNLTRVFINLGNALRETNRVADAVSVHRRSVELQPDSADAHFNLALTLLTAGEYEEGWREHEWRWRSTGFTSAPRDFAQPTWDSRIDPNGKRILIHAEQGFGDTLQFCRYAPRLATLGAKVIVECQPQLVRLLKSLDGIIDVIPRGQILPEFDYRIAMMSLPYAFGTTIKSIPENVPYLRASPAALKLNEPGYKVGLAWAGNPNRQLDHLRSLTLAQLAPLAAAANVTFYSLQKLAGAEQASTPPAGMKLIDHTRAFSDFADTAGLVSQLDLVITIDTAAAHLAGAMGKPVWILLPFAGGWRWFTDRTDSPWYPSARLFRQPKPGDWQSVIDYVRDSLIQHLESIA